MALTASIVVHKTPRIQLEKALNSLLKSEVETVFILENSPDPLLRSITQVDPRIIYQHIENRGFGHGHNTAIRQILESNKEAINGLHLVMNADIWWENDIIQPLVNYMHKNPEVGMIMPKVYYPDGDLQLTCRMLPTPFDLFAKRFLPGCMTRKKMERYLLADHNHDVELNSPYLLGSFLLFRNKALAEIGGFDERFFMYPEDIDITRRIHRRWKTMYWPGVSIIHEHQAASRKSSKMLKIHILNMIKYFNKWGWFRDKERKEFNLRLRSSITFQQPSLRPSSRG